MMLWVLCLLAASGQGVADRDLKLIQNDIVRSDGPGGYYDTSYRKMEFRYWQEIPGWMTEDAGRRKAGRILDIGCGYGTLLTLATQIYAAHGFCMDIHEYLRPAFAHRHALIFVRGNIELRNVPWAGKFDVIILTEVLEHFNFQPLPTLRKIHDALAVGGVLFLSTPDQRDWGRLMTYYKRLSDLPMPDPAKPIRDAHIWIYSKEELVNLLQQAGFEIRQLSYAQGNGNRHFNVEAVAR